MDVEQLSFFGRLRVIFRMITSLLFHRMPQRDTSTRWSASPDVPRPPIPRGPRPELGDLRTVIAIAQTQAAAEIDVTLFSLESYENGFIVLGQHSAKYGEIGQENIWHAMPVLTARDDLGNEYQWWPVGSSRTRFSCQFSPAVHAGAAALTLTVTRFHWVFHTEQRVQVDDGPWIFTVSLA